jgi:hypothetical protein
MHQVETQLLVMAPAGILPEGAQLRKEEQCRSETGPVVTVLLISIHTRVTDAAYEF